MEIASLYDIYLKHPSVQTDTRKLQKGDIFFALKGPNFNANTFALQALADGASYAVIDDPAYATHSRCILVHDALTTLQQLANYHRRQFNIPFIAITGSNGKTTTKELVTAVLTRKYKTYATQGNLNNHIGIPLTLLGIHQDAEIAVIEMGANHLYEIAGYCQVAMPTHGIITNCGKAHLEGFGGVEGVRKGKGELYDYLKATEGTIFRNADLEYLKDMAKGVAHEITYGTKDASYTGQPVMDGVFLHTNVQLKSGDYHIASHLVGDYNFPNIMVAVTLGLHFGIPMPDIQAAIALYNPDNSRSQWLQKGTNRIILDAYNANPTSMRAAIVNFAKAGLANKILWLGAMKEMGADEKTEHEELVKLVNEYKWQDVILVGKEFNSLAGNHHHFLTSAEAAEYVRSHAPQHATILVKGSRGSKMELMTDALNA